jgi:hypothetical protein
VIASQAVLIAIGIDWDGRRQVLAAELANRESRSSWRDFLLALKTRGLNGVEFRGGRRSRGAAGRAPRGYGGGSLSALLCALLEERAQLRAALGRRRLPGLSGMSRAAGRLNQSGHSQCEALAEEDGELGLGHGPLVRRHDPLLFGAVQDQEDELGGGFVTGESTALLRTSPSSRILTRSASKKVSG